MQLRPYQQEASAAVMQYISRSVEPVMFEAATGAGKSLIISDIGDRIFTASEKRVLCLAPSAELVKQNHAKFVAAGGMASIYSASAGHKCLRHSVVFGTPGTVKNRITRFAQDMAAVVIDECHRITPTVLSIVDALRQTNPRMRVIGCTATPYRMNEGYIFRQWPDDTPVSEHQRLENAFFAKCVYRITARELLAQGYLTPVTVGAINSGHYDTSQLERNTMNNFTAQSLDRAFHGHGRLTASIVADIVAQAQNRRGVLIFAATVQHAAEVMASLPPGLSACITGNTKAAERKSILERFARQEIKYLVNVAVLTTGFDAPHIDVVALLRHTESVALLQQIIGRGLRLYDGKADCLLLDYAENIETHCPDGDIFEPEITVRPPSSSYTPVKAVCPDCGTENEFAGRPNEEGYLIDAAGYFTDLDGVRIDTDYGYLPAHYGRRCYGESIVAGVAARCGYRWTFKECPSCGHENDIAARYCKECREELVDPNEKLVKDFKALKRDPTRKQCDRVVDFAAKPSVSRNGREVIRCDVVTEYRRFSYWLMNEPTHAKALHDLELFKALGGETPNTISYRKEPDSGFYRVYGYNGEPDELEQTE